MSTRNYNQRSKLLILILVLPAIAILVFVGLSFTGFELMIPLGIPLLILIAIGVILIKFSWNPQNYCARCKYPVSVYAEYCRNCGLKLISRCPNCDSYIKEGISRCNKCGYSITINEQQYESVDYQRIEKGSKLPLKPNFCPTCGASLKNAENLRYCEYCGSKIKK
jgi:predicted amidophosphoribosyltransferase